MREALVAHARCGSSRTVVSHPRGLAVLTSRDAEPSGGSGGWRKRRYPRPDRHVERQLPCTGHVTRCSPGVGLHRRSLEVRGLRRVGCLGVIGGVSGAGRTVRVMTTKRVQRQRGPKPSRPVDPLALIGHAGTVTGEDAAGGLPGGGAGAGGAPKPARTNPPSRTPARGFPWTNGRSLPRWGTRPFVRSRRSSPVPFERPTAAALATTPSPTGWGLRPGAGAVRRGLAVAESVLPETDADSVRLMTIHAAKGLRFPDGGPVRHDHRGTQRERGAPVLEARRWVRRVPGQGPAERGRQGPGAPC